MHPRTEARLREAGLDPGQLEGRGLVLCPPLGYLDFLALEAKAAFVLTDSGGVQEETSALGVRCFTLRDTTERPVTVELGTNTVLGVDPERIRAIPENARAGKTARPQRSRSGTEGAGGRAAAVLRSFLAAESAGAPLPETAG